MAGARTLAKGCTAAAVGYTIYAAATDSGLYRWLNESPAGRLRGEDSGSTFVILALVLCALSALVSALVSRALGLKKDAPPVSQRVQRSIALVVGLAAAGAGAAIAAHASALAEGPVSYEPLDLAASSAPRGHHVEVRGVAQPGWRVRVESDLSTVDYMPLTGPDWKPDMPVRYFGKLSLEDAGRGARPSNRGLLVENGVPSSACALFAEHGLKLASPVFLLDSDPHAEVMPWVVAAIVCGTLVLGCFGAAIHGGRGVRAPRQ